MNKQNASAVSHGLTGLMHSNQECNAAESSDSVCIITVAYFPDNEFGERIYRLQAQATQIVVVDNTPQDSRAGSLRGIFQGNRKIHLIENRFNLGISTALNQGLRHALSNGFKWILTLDQDSQCYPDMVDTLVKVSKESKLKPMVIGGNYLDPNNQRTKVPVGNSGDSLEQKTVITSGSLIDVDLATAIGGFRDDYFIDQVDHEFCLRVRAHGHKVVISCKPVMRHTVGSPGGVRMPFLGTLPNHQPLRKYYIARNTVITLACYWRREPEWCLRRLVRLVLGLGYMAIMEQESLNKILAFSAGIADGIFHRLGPCQRKWLLRTK